MTDQQQLPPAGYYATPDGAMRWWDGTQWTDYYAPTGTLPSVDPTEADDAQPDQQQTAVLPSIDRDRDLEDTVVVSHDQRAAAAEPPLAEPGFADEPAAPSTGPGTGPLGPNDTGDLRIFSSLDETTETPTAAPVAESNSGPDARTVGRTSPGADATDPAGSVPVTPPQRDEQPRQEAPRPLPKPKQPRPPRPPREPRPEPTLKVESFPGVEFGTPHSRSTIARVLPLVALGLVLLGALLAIIGTFTETRELIATFVVLTFIGLLVAAVGVWASWNAQPRSWRFFSLIVLGVTVFAPLLLVMFLLAVLIILS